MTRALALDFDPGDVNELRDVDLPSVAELDAAEQGTVELLRVPFGAVGFERAAEALGKDRSTLTKALSPSRRQRQGSRCKLQLRDGLMGLLIARELGYDDLAKHIVGVGVEHFSAEELVAAHEQVLRETFAPQEAARLRARTRDAARRNRLRGDRE